MANDNQNLTNPDNLVDVNMLGYFKEKLKESGATVVPASEQVVADLIDELI